MAPAYNPGAEKARTGRPQGLAGGQPNIISEPQTVREPVSESKADGSWEATWGTSTVVCVCSQAHCAPTAPTRIHAYIHNIHTHTPTRIRAYIHNIHTHIPSAHRKLAKMSEGRDSEILFCIKPAKRLAKIFRVNTLTILQRFMPTQGVSSKKNSRDLARTVRSVKFELPFLSLSENSYELRQVSRLTPLITVLGEQR